MLVKSSVISLAATGQHGFEARNSDEFERIPVITDELVWNCVGIQLEKFNVFQHRAWWLTLACWHLIRRPLGLVAATVTKERAYKKQQRNGRLDIWRPSVLLHVNIYWVTDNQFQVLTETRGCTYILPLQYVWDWRRKMINTDPGKQPTRIVILNL